MGSSARLPLLSPSPRGWGNVAPSRPAGLRLFLCPRHRECPPPAPPSCLNGEQWVGVTELRSEEGDRAGAEAAGGTLHVGAPAPWGPRAVLHPQPLHPAPLLQGGLPRGGGQGRNQDPPPRARSRQAGDVLDREARSTLVLSHPAGAPRAAPCAHPVVQGRAGSGEGGRAAWRGAGGPCPGGASSRSRLAAGEACGLL